MREGSNNAKENSYAFNSTKMYYQSRNIDFSAIGKTIGNYENRKQKKFDQYDIIYVNIEIQARYTVPEGIYLNH
jgi:hypothetical protein